MIAAVGGDAVRLPRITGGSRWRALGLLVADGVGQAAMAVAGGLAVGRAFDALAVPRPVFGDIAVLAAVVALTGLVVAGLRAAEKTLAESVGQSYVHGLRMRLLDQVLATAPRDAGQRSTGGTALRFTSDLTAFRRWVSLGVARLVVAVPMLTLAIGFLAWLAWPLAIAAATGVTVGLIGYALLAVRLRKSSRTARRHRGRLASDVTERIARLPVITAHGAEGRERSRIRRRSTELWHAELVRSRHVGGLRAAAEAGTAAATALLVIGAALGQVPPADVATALIVLAVVVAPLRDLGRVYEYRASYVVARHRIQQVLARPVRPLDQRTAELPVGDGLISLEGVTVDGVLNDVSLTAQPGQVVAVVGPNGAGKSTLVQMLGGLVTPDGGRVSLDGAEVHAVDPKQLRAAIGTISPDLPLLRGSVGRNLRYRVPDATEEQVADARRSAGVDEVLAALPEGEKTRLGEAGAGLSQGQQIRLMLARALLGRPRVLLLDEADAHLDPTTVRLLRTAISSFDGTVVCIAHRPDLLDLADVTWRVADSTVRTQQPTGIAPDPHTE